MRLDASKLDLMKSRTPHRGGDFAVTWAKMPNKGRVYYSTLGHPREPPGDKPEARKMFTEAIKWALGSANVDVTPRPLKKGKFRHPASSAKYPLYFRGTPQVGRPANLFR